MQHLGRRIRRCVAAVKMFPREGYRVVRHRGKFAVARVVYWHTEAYTVREIFDEFVLMGHARIRLRKLKEEIHVLAIDHRQASSA